MVQPGPVRRPVGGMARGLPRQSSLSRAGGIDGVAGWQPWERVSGKAGWCVCGGDGGCVLTSAGEERADIRPH